MHLRKSFSIRQNLVESVLYAVDKKKSMHFSPDQDPGICDSWGTCHQLKSPTGLDWLQMPTRKYWTKSWGPLNESPDGLVGSDEPVLLSLMHSLEADALYAQVLSLTFQTLHLSCFVEN